MGSKGLSLVCTGLTGFYRVLLGFTWFQSVMLGFSGFLMDFLKVLLTFRGF